MNRVGFLGQNHPGHSHPCIPEVIQPPGFPKAEQSQDEHRREELQPHFVDGVSPIENKSGGNRHGQGCYSTYVSPDQWLEFQGQPNATNAHQNNRQPQRPEIPAEQTFRQQQDVKVQGPVVIRRIVSVKAVMYDLIHKPAIDAFIEMRRLDTQQKQTQERSQPQD